MSLVLYGSLASGSNELAQVVEEAFLKRMAPGEKKALENMASQVEDLAIEPILNHEREKTLQRFFIEKIPIFWSYLLAINYMIIKNYGEVGIGGMEVLQQDEHRLIQAMLKVIRSAKEKIGARETAALLFAVRTLWEYDSLILSSYVRSHRTTEQAILGLDLNDLQQTVCRVCLPVLLSLVVINENLSSDIRLRNVKKLALVVREYSRELSDYIETLDILVSPSSAKFEAAADEDLRRHRFADLHELAKRR